MKQRPFKHDPQKASWFYDEKARLEHTPNQRKEKGAKHTEQANDKLESNQGEVQSTRPVKETHNGAPKKATQTTEEHIANTNAEPPPTDV